MIPPWRKKVAFPKPHEDAMTMHAMKMIPKGSSWQLSRSPTAHCLVQVAAFSEIIGRVLEEEEEAEEEEECVERCSSMVLRLHFSGDSQSFTLDTLQAKGAFDNRSFRCATGKAKDT